MCVLVKSVCALDGGANRFIIMGNDMRVLHYNFYGRLLGIAIAGDSIAGDNQLTGARLCTGVYSRLG